MWYNSILKTVNDDEWRRQLARRFGPFKFEDDDDGKLVSLIIAERIWFRFYFILKTCGVCMA